MDGTLRITNSQMQQYAQLGAAEVYNVVEPGTSQIVVSDFDQNNMINYGNVIYQGKGRINNQVKQGGTSNIINLQKAANG